MAKYVVKNCFGHWLSERSQMGPIWTTCRADRCDTVSLDVARSMARWSGGKVYRVRRPSAKRERLAVVKFIDGLARQETGMLRAVFSDVANRITDGEHRRKK